MPRFWPGIERPRVQDLAHRQCCPGTAFCRWQGAAIPQGELD